MSNDVSLSGIPSPFYRVATRAIVLDDQGRILIMKNHDGDYELPGGGWEYDESFDTCLEREILEELGVAVASVEPGILCVYRGRGTHGKMNVRIAVRATLKSYDFKPVDMAHAEFVTKDEFLALDLKPAAEEELKDYAHLIWP
ncbi:MAG: NUDIX hydrolase [Candidatus Saccharimonadales bacterium]